MTIPLGQLFIQEASIEELNEILRRIQLAVVTLLATQEITGAKTFKATTILDGDVVLGRSMRWKSRTVVEITADQDNYDPGVGIAIRLSSDASRTITGITGGVDGRRLLLINAGSNDIVFANQSASSQEVNRIITGTGGSVTVAADNLIQLWYDSTTQRWRVI